LVGVSRFTKEIPASRAVREHQPNHPSIIDHDLIVCFVLLVLPGNLIRKIEILQRETPTMALFIVPPWLVFPVLLKKYLHPEL
jgi:hypothetical protein